MARREIDLKYSTECYECGERMQPGERVIVDYDNSGTTIWHKACDRSKKTEPAAEGRWHNPYKERLNKPTQEIFTNVDRKMELGVRVPTEGTGESSGEEGCPP